MRICLISNLYGKNARGGAERIVMLEAERLVARGHEAIIIAGTADAEGEGDDGAANGVRTVRVRPPNLFFYADAHKHGAAARFAWHLLDMVNAGSARKVRAILERERPDVVHTHNLMGLGFLIPRAVRRLRLPHVHTVHDVQLIHPSGLIVQDERAGLLATVARAIYAACMRALMGSPDVVIFPSRFLADLHARYGFFPRSRIEVVPNPAPVAAGRGAQEERRSVLFVGQLETHKGVMTLLDAWMLGPLPGMTLEIAGTGAMEKDVRARAERMERVTVHGFLQGDGLEAAYGRAAYVVVPSLVIENQPTVILEAFNRGIPVIAASVGGIPELVEDGLTGLLCTPRDAEALAKALADAPSRLADAEAVRDRITERIARHDVGRHVERLEEIYKGSLKA